MSMGGGGDNDDMDIIGALVDVLTSKQQPHSAKKDHVDMSMGGRGMGYWFTGISMRGGGESIISLRRGRRPSSYSKGGGGHAAAGRGFGFGRAHHQGDDEVMKDSEYENDLLGNDAMEEVGEDHDSLTQSDVMWG